MLTAVVQAVRGKAPFDLLIRNIQIVNVYNSSIAPGCIGVVGEHIVYVGPLEPDLHARRVIDGQGRYALPGFVDSHMHLESSMLAPAHFARIALGCGTTTVAADPHEIGNVMGLEGVRALVEACEGLPLRTLVMAPSTIPSAPGYEGSGYEVGAGEMDRLLDLPGVWGLGEVMDFNAVADGEERILSVIERARRRHCLLDGHASLLTGARLQAFRATGIDSDHTTNSPEKLREELALGFTVQVQESMLSEEMVRAMNEAPVQDRICLVTDDVPLHRLMRDGHLNHVVEKAISLGLEPVRAIRFATINAAQRLRLYDVGGLAPGMAADVQLVEDIRRPKPVFLLRGGEVIVEEGRFLPRLPVVIPPILRESTMDIGPVREEDFRIRVEVPNRFPGGRGKANLIGQDGVGVRTKRVERTLKLEPEENGSSEVRTEKLLKMAVFNRYGKKRRGLALVDGMDGVTGAVALTYGHDCHNLTVFGGNDADMALAANAVIEAGGGLCTVQGGKVRHRISLPLAGLMCDLPPEELLGQMEELLEHCREMGFRHKNLLTFLTVMPLAVSPEIKCTDMGLLDVAHKKFLPLVEGIEEDG